MKKSTEVKKPGRAEPTAQHLMGKNTGYHLFPGGSCSVAPMHAQRINDIAADEAAVRELLGHGIQWPPGMMPASEFISSATGHYRTAANLRANNHHASAAHEELNALLCQLAPALLSIAESLAVIARVTEQVNDSGLRVCP